MARITVEDCLKKVGNRFLLVNMVAKRVRQIREGSDYLVSSPKNEDVVISLREIAAGRIIRRENPRRSRGVTSSLAASGARIQESLTAPSARPFTTTT